MKKNKTVHSFADVSAVCFDFDGVFTNNFVYVDQNGFESVRCSRSDGLGLSKLREINVPMMVISTETNKVVGERCKKLELPYLQGVRDKLIELKKFASAQRLNLSNIVFMGNDINDLDCLKSVGHPVVVPDSHPYILSSIDAYVTEACGGEGAVRELCDLIFQSKL